MSIVPVYIASPYNVSVYLLEGQVHKKSKLEIMTNMGKIYLCKHSQKSNACVDSFGKYIKSLIYCTMYEKCFYFLFKFIF